MSRERFGGAACDMDPATTTLRLHKHGESEEERRAPAGQGHGPPSPHTAAPCGVGVLEGPQGDSENQCRQWDQDNNTSSAARCDCGQHTFLVLPPRQDGSLDTAPNTPDPSSSSNSGSSNSQSIREKRGRVTSGETPTSSSRRHLVLLSEAGLSSTSSSSLAAAAAAAEGGDPADIENLSASMVQAMTRKGSNAGGAGNSSNNSNTAASSSVPPTPPPLGLSSSQQQPQDHHHHPDHQHHHPHPPQQHQQQQQQQRRRGSVSGADGSSNNVDGSSSLVGGNAGEPGALSLDRIVVERNGDMVVVESSVVCDACPSCDDVCTLPDCRGCQEKRERLLARGLMVVLEAWGRTTRKESVQKQQQQASPEGGVCMPIITIAKPRSTNNNDSSSSNHNDTHSSSHNVSYSLCEIRRHRTLASCWLVAKGQVYDVTSYLSSHPAGAIAIARKAGGQDCSEDFEFHSGKAQKMWKNLRIGSVKACPAEGRCGGGGRGGGREGGREDGSLVGSSCSIM